MWRSVLVSIVLAVVVVGISHGVADARGAGGTHVVEWGDTLWAIARENGTTVDSIKQSNGLRSDWIYAGQRLWIPAENPGGGVPGLPGGLPYVVQWGDTLWSIARGHGTTVAAIMRANHLRSHRIYAGQRLLVPLMAPRPVPTPVPHPMPTPVPRLPEVVLAPWSGPPGAMVTMTAIGFRPWADIQIGVGPYGSEFTPLMTVTADGRGTAVARVRAHGTAGMNLVIAARSSGAPGVPTEYASGLFRIQW